MERSSSSLGSADSSNPLPRAPAGTLELQTMSVHTVIFECQICRHPVTCSLAPLPPDQQVCVEDGKPAVPQGYFALSDDDYWTGSSGCALINLADLRNFKYHLDPRRSSGCCGRDG